MFVAFLISTALKFMWSATYQSYLDRSSLLGKAREALLPMLSAQLFSGLLTMLSVYVVVRTGTIGLAIAGVMIVIFQYLAGELLTSKRRGSRLAMIAMIDELTGVANREQFRARLECEIAACDEHGGVFAVMLIDLDHFKEINDTLGHHYGDQLRERPDHRPFDDPPRARPRDEGDRRGCRGRGHARAARVTRLRPDPGLLRQPPLPADAFTEWMIDRVASRRDVDGQGLQVV